MKKLNVQSAGALVLFSAALALLISGCGGGSGLLSKNNGGNGGGSSGGNGGSTLTNAQIGAALDAAQAKFNTLPKDFANHDKANQQLLAFVRSRPEFEASDIDADAQNVWARFKNNRLVIFANNRPIFSGTARGQTRQAALSPANSANTEIPTPKQARLLNTFTDSGYSAAAPDIAKLLTKPMSGYTLAPSDTSVEGFKAIQGDGVFYIDTHGGGGRVRLTPQFTGPSELAFALMTSTDVKVGEGVADPYAADLDAGRLVYFITSSGTNYGITKYFIRQYVKFGKNSFVFMNACKSDYADFRQACLDAGASVYAGWTRSVPDDFAYKTANYVFPQLLGDSDKTGALDISTLQTTMQQKGLDTVSLPVLKGKPPYLIKLIFTAGNNNFGQLAPSLDSVSYDKTKNELTLSGRFGTNPGNDGVVKVAGSVLNKYQWSPTQIVGSTNACGPNPLDVSVTVRGHISNQKPVSLPCTQATPVPTPTPPKF